MTTIYFLVGGAMNTPIASRAEELDQPMQMRMISVLSYITSYKPIEVNRYEESR